MQCCVIAEHSTLICSVSTHTVGRESPSRRQAQNSRSDDATGAASDQVPAPNRQDPPVYGRRGQTLPYRIHCKLAC